MAQRIYCTYFDQRYLPRGLALIESIRKFDETAQIFVLALDRKCHFMVGALAGPGVTPVLLEKLEAADPDLAAVKATRKQVEYYFTLTSCWARYLLDTHPEIEMLTYLDADMHFFASPEIIHREIGDASVAITPHRFSPERAHLVKFGTYNVGWVSWRNDEVGRRCLEDYRNDCLEWCHDRLEGDRYADQKYLDKWPTRYPNVHVIEHPGANVAVWNINNYDLSQIGDDIAVSGRPLVFWHYHALREQPDGRWSIGVDDQMAARNPDLVAIIFHPYVARLIELKAQLEDIFGPLESSTDIRYHNPASSGTEPTMMAAPANRAPAPSPHDPGYQIVSREEAIRLANESHDGWHHDDVAEAQGAAYNGLLAQMHAGNVRRDLALAAQVVRSLPLETPSLLEVGCGSGYYSEVFAHLNEGRIRYTGLDYSPAMIRLASRAYPGTAFQVGDATALPYPDNSFDVVFNGVSLMHILDYEKAIQEARRVASKFIILHTLVMRRAGPTVYLHKHAYGRPVVEIVLSETEVRRLLAKYGMVVAASAESISYDLSAVLGEPTYTRTLLCALLPGGAEERPSLLNVGCGGHFHPNWVNVDIKTSHPAVMEYNVLEGLPYADATFDAVYHSHMLEHLPKWQAPGFMRECARVLKPGGVLRVAIPDLETICRLYLRNLEGALTGDAGASDRYDWMLMELLDQMARSESGGEMARFWRQQPMPAEDFVIQRVGAEVEGFLNHVRNAPRPPTNSDQRPRPTPETVGAFRLGGEVHQWMYDRFSLARLMTDAGLKAPRVVTATESALPGFAAYNLDADQAGRTRKPDSLFMEALQP